MSRPSRKRTATFDWHTLTDDQDGPPPTIRLRHADMSVNDAAGRPSMRSSFITAPASPSKTQQTERVYEEDYLLHQGLDVLVDDGMATEGLQVKGEWDGEGELAVDPQYQRHLDENLLGPAKQKRTQVCW